MKKYTDTQMIEQILITIRKYYNETYTGYDIWIDRKNLVKHIHSLCHDHAKMTEQLGCISGMINK